MGEVEKEFFYTYNDCYGECRLTAPIPIPLEISCREYTYRLINSFNIPSYLEKELFHSLEEFVKNETDNYYSQQAEDALKHLKSDNDFIENLSEIWTKAFTEEHMTYSKPEDISNEAIFSEVYHRMVHSSALDSLMNLEYSYAIAMEDLIRERNSELLALQKKQAQEVEDIIQKVGIESTDEEVNALAARHFEDNEILQTKWASELSALHDAQKKEFVEWITKSYEEYHTYGTTNSLERFCDEKCASKIPTSEWIPEPCQMEESFTIHLGAQMKQMHNLRLLATDVLTFCWEKMSFKESVLPHRLQTAMSLYSNNLCGMVLLVDNRINSYTGIKKEFADICQHSSEFHFSDMETQLESIRQEVAKVVNWRMNCSQNKLWTTGPNKEKNDGKNGQHYNCGILKTGDLYITRHSNLAEMHVIFHLIVDDSLHSNDITSRHPVILALRNMLKVACMCDITILTLPLLLVHELTEEMTIPWCLKRAELVFKCIKGFMMEMASWGGSESRTVQFIVPKGISEELFTTLSSLLPSIFRISNPLIVKTS